MYDSRACLPFDKHPPGFLSSGNSKIEELRELDVHTPIIADDGRGTAYRGRRERPGDPIR